MARTQKTNFFRAHYDKFIVVFVLIALLLSLFFLISLSSSQRDKEKAFKDKLDALSPEFPEAVELDAEIFDATLAAIAKPVSISAGNLLVACERVACVACGWPIKMEDEVCQYCNARQPPEVDPVGLDSDGDGMPDVYEQKYGMNPVDKLDASADLDRDNFTNLEEFLGKTDPSDAKNYPPRVDFLRVQKIDAIRFPYILKTKSTMGKGLYRFQINATDGQSYFLTVGQEINKSGYKVVSFTNKVETVKASGIPDRKREIAVLKLSNGTEEVELVEGAGAPLSSSEVTFICEKDMDAKPILAKHKDSFTFDGETYKVVSIEKDKDSSSGTVVIKQESTQREIKVPGI